MNKNHLPKLILAASFLIVSSVLKAAERSGSNSPQLVKKGIPNIGNTCFMNATLAMIFNSPFDMIFEKKLQRHSKEKEASYYARIELQEALYSLFLDRRDRYDNYYYFTYEHLNSLIRSWDYYRSVQSVAFGQIDWGLSEKEQQDALEFFRRALNLMEARPVARLEIREPVLDEDCKEGLELSLGHGVDLNVYQENRDQNIISLWLNDTFAQDLQAHINQQFGHNITVTSDLIDWRSRGLDKVDAAISRYISDDTKEIYFAIEDRISDFKDEHGEWMKNFKPLTFNPLNPVVSLPVYSKGRQFSEKKMRVHTVVSHLGDTTKAGHYVAYSYDTASKQWYVYNDSSVAVASEKDLSDMYSGARILHLVECDG